MTSRPEVVGIVMAAGGSTRFGPPKQLLSYGNTTLLGHIVDLVNASTLEQIVVVLGREAEQVRGSVDWGRAAVVDNLAYGAGCASSLLAGMDTAGDCSAIMLLLGDQPGVRTQDIDQVHQQWLDHRPWAAATVYRGMSGHPLVFARGAFEDLRALHGDKAVWKLIEQYPDRVRSVAVDADLPEDVDTPVDAREPTDLDRAPSLQLWAYHLRDHRTPGLANHPIVDRPFRLRVTCLGRVMSIAGNSRQSSDEATHLQPAFSSFEYCKLPTSAALLQRRLARPRLLWNHRILQSGTEASSSNAPITSCGD